MQIRLLLDANLSWRSIVVLNKYFDNCCHVDNIGLSIPAKDLQIWNYAKEHEMLIVTNDEDFMHLSIINGFPPKVLLLRTGNQNRKYIEHILIKIKTQIGAFMESTEQGVLEII